MEDNTEKLSLLNIKGGALVEQFDIALDRVVANLADINTSLKPREIHLVVKITPNTDRTFLEIAAGVKSRLAGQENITTTADLRFTGDGRAEAWSRKGRQLNLPLSIKKASE